MDKEMFIEMIEINQQAACLRFRIENCECVSHDEIMYVLDVILRITAKYVKQLLDCIEEG